MLTYIDKKRAAGFLDSKVKNLARQICLIWPDMEDFERLFKHHLEKMQQVNHIKPEFAYKLVRHDKNTMEVWHVSLEEMIHDRLLCVVEYTSEIDLELALLESQIE